MHKYQLFCCGLLVFATNNANEAFDAFWRQYRLGGLTAYDMTLYDNDSGERLLTVN